MGLRETIEERLNELDSMLRENRHLGTEAEASAVLAAIAAASKFWPALDEQDRDYLNAARMAVEEKLRWGD